MSSKSSSVVKYTTSKTLSLMEKELAEHKEFVEFMKFVSETNFFGLEGAGA